MSLLMPMAIMADHFSGNILPLTDQLPFYCNIKQAVQTNYGAQDDQ
jgi:hypothetical protein